MERSLRRGRRGHGLLPHVLHHIGIFAGAALVTGAAGNLAFGALGLLLSTPMLLRLHHRFHTWKAPALAVAMFAAMFALSAFVLGPAVTGANEQPNTQPAPTKAPDPVEHASHHGG